MGAVGLVDGESGAGTDAAGLSTGVDPGEALLVAGAIGSGFAGGAAEVPTGWAGFSV
jgi:hypothetical protein